MTSKANLEEHPRPAWTDAPGMSDLEQRQYEFEGGGAPQEFLFGAARGEPIAHVAVLGKVAEFDDSDFRGDIAQGRCNALDMRPAGRIVVFEEMDDPAGAMQSFSTAHAFQGRTTSRYTASLAAAAPLPVAKPTSVASALGLPPNASGSAWRYANIPGCVHSRIVPADLRTHNPSVRARRSAIGCNA